MNRIFRLIWSDAAQTWVVTHEHAKSRGKRSSSASSALLLAGALLAPLALAAPPAPPAPNALPTGGQVAAGQAVISQAGSTMTIQQATDKAILNWQSFNIGANATVNFQQPNAGSVALNRVLGQDPSAIFGSLNANGQVFLVNAQRRLVCAQRARRRGGPRGQHNEYPQRGLPRRQLPLHPRWRHRFCGQPRQPGRPVRGDARARSPQ
jgi:hypothetical protein